MSEDKEAPVVDVKRGGAGSYRGADVSGSEGSVTGVWNPAQRSDQTTSNISDDSIVGVSVLQL